MKTKRNNIKTKELIIIVMKIEELKMRKKRSYTILS